MIDRTQHIAPDIWWGYPSRQYRRPRTRVGRMVGGALRRYRRLAGLA